MSRTSHNAAGFEALRARAIALRRSGKSRLQIKQALGVRSNETLTKLLRGTVPPESLLRPRAKDDLRRRARELRAQGRTYAEIAAELGVSKSSISLWVRDLPREGRLSPEEIRRRNDEGRRRYWERERAEREAARRAVSDTAAAEIGRLSDREILMLGAVAYWCEGTKNKPHYRHERVTFTNSDPGLIRFFLRFLDVAGVERRDLILRVSIHESADVGAAHAFWREATGAEAASFGRPTLKRHSPSTVRHNVGDGYHGCLRIDVRRSGWLYRKIEGWMLGVTNGRAEQGRGSVF
ncbi:helix-turn-helix domain-containing protein [Microbispora sp. NPDC049125]|uniref:helix-turn-helix domain-containing protein n=1 Tax=Microbispora sp. NPDC049125 TaxID=3154929 RepID=UPI003467E6F6